MSAKRSSNGQSKLDYLKKYVSDDSLLLSSGGEAKRKKPKLIPQQPQQQQQLPQPPQQQPPQKTKSSTTTSKTKTKTKTPTPSNSNLTIVDDDATVNAAITDEQEEEQAMELQLRQQAINMATTLGTKSKSGLFESDEVVAELEAIRDIEKQRLEHMDPALSGAGAKTIYRDKRGRVRDVAAERDAQIAEEKQRKLEEDQQHEWGSGLIQKQEKLDLRERLLEERYKPFARSEDDPELEEMRKSRERWGDPMAMFLKQQGATSSTNIDEEGDHKRPPTYKGPPAPPNRFNILPGFRWDGVDRSNGFETRFFQRQSEAIDRAEKAYKWSTADM